MASVSLRSNQAKTVANVQSTSNATKSHREDDADETTAILIRTNAKDEG